MCSIFSAARLLEGSTPGTMLCVVTRAAAPTRLALLWMLGYYLRIRRQARHVQGLLATSVSVEWPRGICVFSLWADEEAMGKFATVALAHPGAVGRLWDEGGQFWSGAFELVGPSRRSVEGMAPGAPGKGASSA